MHDRHESACRGRAEGDETVLLIGMFRIMLRHCQRVAENGRRVGKCDFVLGEIRCRLAGIPFELHRVRPQTIDLPRRVQSLPREGKIM